jgi:hypothetical protein
VKIAQGSNGSDAVGSSRGITGERRGRQTRSISMFAGETKEI